MPASAYQRKVNIKIAMGSAGGAAILGGGILLFSTGSQGQCDFSEGNYNPCIIRSLQLRTEHDKKSRLGMATMGVGSILLALAIALNPHPVAPSEARRLAESYNERLKVDLGLSGERKLSPSALPSIQARLTPTMTAGGAGLLLSSTL